MIPVGGKLDEAIAYNRDRVDRRKEIERHRDFTMLVALFQQERGLVVDGKFGPKTKAALEAALAPAPEVDRTNGVALPIPWPPFDGPLEKRPATLAEVIEAFGDPIGEDGHADPTWKRVMLMDRGPDDPLPGCPTEGPGRYVTINRIAEPYADEGLRRAQLAAPSFRIKRIGCYNHRRRRHDPYADWSWHAWAIALDINADDNGAMSFGPGECPEPWSPEWLAIWPDGLPRAFVEAMESVGWRWGGRWKRFCDPMHFEFVGAGDVEV